MSIFTNKENRIRCGRCNTEFDFNKNQNGCPICGFGKNTWESAPIVKSENLSLDKNNYNTQSYLSIPPVIKLNKGSIILDEETTKVGLWGMFNDFFSGKALLRISANLINERKVDYVSVEELIENAKKVIAEKKLFKLKGFPNDIESESSVGRLVYHFIANFQKMGLFEVKLNSKPEKTNIWSEDWKKILIKPTQEGLEFARFKNKVFDENKYEDQTLTTEESKWLVNYLKEIDKKGFKEYTLLFEVFSFIKKGNNGNKDLWQWFKSNTSFVEYVQRWSSKNDDQKAFEKQLLNLAQTFSSGKVSLLRELGIIKNKRNDYTVIGELK